MSWVLEDSLRVSIDNDPDLVSLFSEWLEDHREIEEITRTADRTSLRATFHARHKNALQYALIDLAAELNRPKL